MGSWLFVDVPLEPGEELLFRRTCTRRRGRRSIGGEVSVTDRRLLFVPNRLEQLVGAPTSSYPRDVVDHVVVVPPPPAWERLAALPGAPKARAEIEAGEELLLLQLEDAEALAQVLRPGG